MKDEEFTTVETIIAKASEEYDRFIFSTIRPFCEEVVQHEISKKDLTEALTQWKKRGTWVPIDQQPHEDWECDQCGAFVYGTENPYMDYKYCPQCGTKMEAPNGEE